MRQSLFLVLMAVSVFPAHAIVLDDWAPFTQPDGTKFVAHIFGDEFETNWVTGDGYAFVKNPEDGYLYYAELDNQGEYRASSAKVGLDDPAIHGIQKHLQRSDARRAKIQAERIRRGYARVPEGEQGATGRYGDAAHVPCSGTDPCDVYVVMVNFEDLPSGDDYDDYDQPSGYSMALYNRFFNGGYEGVPAYTGTVAHISASHSTENLEVFGSVRAYFHQIHGEDILRFHILNECQNDPCESTDEPVWIPLNSTTHPNTKGWYAQNPPPQFFNAAEAAACANLNLPNDFPLAAPCGTMPAASATTLLGNKVVYLYAGFAAKIEMTGRGLHPRANRVTSGSTNVGSIGARYLMGERDGFHNSDRTADHFAGIGTHVHEIGHMFGLVHPGGGWIGTNPHTDPPQTGTSVGRMPRRGA